MSITDELRKYARQAFEETFADTELWKIANRIDASYRVALEKLAAQLDESSDMREFCERLSQAATNREDVTLFGVDYVALPMDADGVPIHVGDRVENNERVMRIVLTDGSWEPSVYIGKLPNVLHEHFCYEISHYHAPTVEDVLREFAWQFAPEATTMSDQDFEDTVAEYAAKLRLAGEGE